MKKKTSLAALIAALCLLAPAAFLSGCKEDLPLSSSNHPNLESSANISETDTEDSSSIHPLPDSSSPGTSSSAGENSSSSKPPQNSSSASKPPQQDTSSPAAQYIKCTGDNVNIRAGAGTDYAIVGSAEKGTMYAVIGKTGGWYKTYYKNKIAYIYASYASVFTLEKTKDKIESVVEEGYKLLGIPYVYGAVRVHDGNGKLLAGFNAQKFDCSSLVQYIFYKGAGKLLGSHTRAQVLQGQYVKRSDLQRGDCIFFTNESRKNKKGVERVGHVALYLGDGYILHTASDYARIEKISAARWNFYIEARRFI
jgi:cell wall-associated NlpC family hydrolase